MNTEHFLSLLHHPHQITPEDVSSLQDLTRQYPYFQMAYVLLAKVAYEQDPATAKRAIEIAAIHATHRTYLKALLEDKPPFSAPQTPVEAPQPTTLGHDFINGYINTIRQRSKRPITKQTSLTQREIIQTFIQKEVQFRPQVLSNLPDKYFQDDLTQESTAFHDDLATENLARVLMQQGKLKRALEIYEQLLLKFPEKKAYFAPLIEELKSQY